MKKKYWITCVLLAATVLGYAGKPSPVDGPTPVSAPTPVTGPLHLNTDKPRAGQTVSFDYSASGGKLAGATDVHAALFYYTAGKISGYYAEDVRISPAGKDSWKGSFTIPDSAVAFALRLKSGKLTEDNHGRGYISLVYSDGVIRPGAYAGAALLFSNGESALNLTNPSDTALALLEKEFALHPELRQKYESSYYYALAGVKKPEAYPILDKRAQELLLAPGSTAADYRLAMKLFQWQKKKKTADSVLALAATKFPGSELAAQYDENKFYAIKDLDSLVLFYKDFNQRYPQTTPHDPAIEISTYFAAAIVSRYLEKKDYPKAITYTASINDESADYRGFTYNRIAFGLLQNNGSLSLADSVIQLAIAGLDYELAHSEKFKRQGSTLSEWKDELDRYFYAGLADTYGKIPDQQGAYSKALASAQKAAALSKGENAVYNEHYVKSLLKTGDKTTARTKSEEYIKGGFASDSIKIWLKEIYVKDKGSDQGYDSYLAALQSVAKSRFRETAVNEKLDLPSKAFNIPDLEGKNISLESLKGKVVIIDFWATWCGPCKASFPAMQTAIDQFKNDSNVVFLFVDTWESMPADPRVSAVKKFITDNKYSFHVLLDKVVDLEKRQYSVVSDYGIGGIPTKIIISPQGKIVFKAVGFQGNNEKLLTELSVYIELAKG